MNKRERVLRAVEMRRPDRLPILHEYLPAAMLQHGHGLIELLAKYPNDFGSSQHTIPKVSELSPSYRAGESRDEWGTVWRSTADGIHGQVIDYPIKNWEDAAEYEFPELPGDEEIKRRKEQVAEAKKRIFVRAGFNPGNYFERLQWLTGFKTVLTSLVRRPPQFVQFADRLLEYCLESISKILETDPDCVTFADDWGAQDRLLIRPQIWEDFFRPRYERMFSLVRENGAYVQFHSDGYIIDIIESLHEIGVNILNPQFSCHDLEELADVTRGRLCILSDIDRQDLLPRGTREQIREYVENMIDLFGRRNQGGLIGRGELNKDVPLKNVKALYDSLLEYGKYNWNPSQRLGQGP